MKDKHADELLDYSKNMEYQPFGFFSGKQTKDTYQRPLDKEPKKKRKAAKTIARLIKVLIVIGLIVTMGYTLLAGSAINMDKDFFQIKIGNYGVNPTWMPYGDSTEVNDIYVQLEQKGKLQTVYDIYSLACNRLNLSKEYSVRASGSLDLSAGETMATAISNREEHYFVIGQPSLNANQPREFSNYDINYCTELKGNEMIASILQAMMVSAVRSYCDGEKVYEQKSQSLEKSNSGQYEALWKNDYIELEKDFERGYADSDLREKTNFIINTSTILSDSITIERTLEHGAYRYNVAFKLDCSNTNQGSATYYEAEAIKRKMGNTQSFVYSYLDVNFSVYENGYFSYWATKQQYDAEIFYIRLKATMDKKEYLSYDANECNVVNFLND